MSAVEAVLRGLDWSTTWAYISLARVLSGGRMLRWCDRFTQSCKRHAYALAVSLSGVKARGVAMQIGAISAAQPYAALDNRHVWLQVCTKLS